MQQNHFTLVNQLSLRPQTEPSGNNSPMPHSNVAYMHNQFTASPQNFGEAQLKHQIMAEGNSIEPSSNDQGSYMRQHSGNQQTFMQTDPRLAHHLQQQMPMQ